MPLQLPDNRHDSIQWLFDHLEGVALTDAGRWAGTLPAEYNFDEVSFHFNELGGAALSTGTDIATRTIEFVPAWGNVYPNIESMLRVAALQRSSPSLFTILDPKYSHNEPPPVPPGVENAAVPRGVQHYLDAVALCKAMSSLADHRSAGGETLHFIHRHDAKLTVQLTYSVGDLRRIPYLRDVLTEYVESTLHVEQKRNIFRSSLLDMFKGQSAITMGDLLPKFGTLFEVVRDSYAMYAADFSVEGMRRELEKLNLDDTLRLNKTLSDIQNQLLAVPAALILAGASITPESPLRTIATLIGVIIFSALMFLLVSNQKNSVAAIKSEIILRDADLSAQPENVAKRYSESLKELQLRVSRQLSALKVVSVAIWVVLITVLMMVWIALSSV